MKSEYVEGMGHRDFLPSEVIFGLADLCGIIKFISFITFIIISLQKSWERDLVIAMWL